MTTPNQPPPADLDKLLGIGHFEVGGGNSGYGQQVNGGFVNNIVGVTTPNPGNMLSVLAEVLLKIPADILSAFFGGLIPGGLAGIGNIVQGVMGLLNPRVIFQSIEQFATWVANVFTPLQYLVQGINQGLDSIIGIVRRVIDSLVAGLVGIPFFGPAIAAFLGLIQVGASGPEVDAAMDTIFGGVTGVVKKQTADAQNFTISTLSAQRNPSWVSRIPIADVSYPEFMNNRADLFGVTEGASAGTAHTHDLGVVQDPYSVPASRGINWDAARGVYITTQNTTIYDTVAIFAFHGAGTAEDVFLEVFRERVDGSLYMLTSQDITSSLTTTAQYLEYTLPSPIMAQAGERYVVRIRNSNTTANIQVYIRAMREVPGSQEQAFYYTGANALLTEYTAGQAVTGRSNSQNVNWSALATKNQPEPDVSYSDDFNRANLGPYWLSFADGVEVSGQKAVYLGPPGVGSGVGFYIRRTSGDACKVSANLHVDPGNITKLVGIFLHGEADAYQLVYLAITENVAKIFHYDGSTHIERASVDVGGTDLYSLYYDEDDDTYIALKANEPFGLEWDTPGSSVEHGQNYRFGGILIEEDSGEIDNWTLADWAP